MYVRLLTPARGVVMPTPAKAKTKRVRREKLYESCIVGESRVVEECRARERGCPGSR